MVSAVSWFHKLALPPQMNILKSSPKVLAKAMQFLSDNDPNMSLFKLKLTHPCFTAMRTHMMQGLLAEGDGVASLLAMQAFHDPEIAELFNL